MPASSLRSIFFARARTVSSSVFGLAGLGLAGVAIVLPGCPSADPEAKLDAFLEETKDDREEAANMKMDVGGMLADITGTHLFALSATLSPVTPLQFLATVEPAAEDGSMINITFQPLSLDIAATTSPRLPVGETITLTNIPVDAGGAFLIDFGSVQVVGAANPITGADIEATLSVMASIQSEDLWCGSVTGAVTVPLDYDLVGSTFAAVRVEGTDPMSLPMDVLYGCPEGGTTGGSSGSGGDTDTDSGSGDPPTTTG